MNITVYIPCYNAEKFLADWKGNSSYIGADEIVKQGDTITFVMEDRTPVKPGKYRFQKRMARESHGVFGEKTPPSIVTVLGDATP